MRRMVACVLSGAVVVAAGSAILAAPAQVRPGEMTRGEVWIKNRGPIEAVPVNVQDVVSVQVTGTPTVAISPSSVVQARLVRQSWTYRTVTIASGQDPAGVLSKAGDDGWEATGAQFPSRDGIALLLKRPR